MGQYTEWGRYTEERENDGIMQHYLSPNTHPIYYWWYQILLEAKNQYWYLLFVSVIWPSLTQCDPVDMMSHYLF